jgi:hypothetical protein
MSQTEIDNLVEILLDLVRWDTESENPPQTAQLGYLH